MLKIGKGLKKKKKNKKGKGKNEELFTEAELEQYRKEHAQKPIQEAGSSEAGNSSEVAGSEEFEKFQLLTAVDDILKKSQGDLDRIKKESFYQRKPTPSEIKAQEEKEKAELEKSEGNWIGFDEGKVEDGEKIDKEDISHIEEESESEFEDNDDDIFDTAYIDVLEKSDVKLAYVPDDDEIIVDEGPDPFDTSTADELLRKAELEEKRKKKEISLGSAVSVLTGRAERDKELLDNKNESEEERLKKPRARPRKIQDFCLLGSFEESVKDNTSDKPQADTSAVVDVPKSILDEELAVEEDLPEGDVLITEVLVKQVARPPPPELVSPPEKEDNFVTEVEFVLPPVDLELKKLEEEEEFDEFSALAASSVANQKIEEELQHFENCDDDPFDTSVIDSVLRTDKDLFESIEGQAKHLPVEVPQTIPPVAKWSAFDEASDEVDPFDTKFADNCAPGKVELRLIEKEILEAQVEPVVTRKVDIHLEARILSRNNSEDFNPREAEKGNSLASRVSIHITNPSGETQRGSESEDLVALSLSHRDLLGGSTTDLTSLGDQPLPVSSKSPTEDLSRYSDPFDTSVAEQVTAPGRAELRCIESELLSDIREVISDEDFDPRAEDGKSKGVSFDIPSPIQLSSDREEGGGVRPLTPYYADPVSAESDIEVDIDDPFDTSHVSSLPGKQELKLIEEELERSEVRPIVFQPIHEKLGIAPDVVEVGGLKHSISDQDFNPRADNSELNIVQPSPIRRYSDISGLNNPPQTLPLRTLENKPDLLVVEEELPDKALTPATEEDISNYIDPFDTSIAENIAPGKAELRVLEVELVGSITRSYTDPDFNPRDSSVAVPEGKLKTVPSTKPLKPLDLSEVNEEIDPFDTSIANNIAPGRAELRLLESELFG